MGGVQDHTATATYAEPAAATTATTIAVSTAACSTLPSSSAISEPKCSCATGYSAGFSDCPNPKATATSGSEDMATCHPHNKQQPFRVRHDEQPSLCRR